mmetsp:Transcript_56085/g.167861  ORF Transcript_56085/g.167861 Transcript_56085/m.167861 type:complete len:117 (+) Transcript_56085:802-1152(+)
MRATSLPTKNYYRISQLYFCTNTTTNLSFSSRQHSYRSKTGVIWYQRGDLSWYKWSIQLKFRAIHIPLDENECGILNIDATGTMRKRHRPSTRQSDARINSIQASLGSSLRVFRSS